MSHAVGRVENVQRAERHQGHGDADDHCQQLQKCWRGAVAGIDGGRERETGGCRTGQIGEHTDDLRSEVVAAELTLERITWLGLPLGIGSLDESDELAVDLVGVGRERQLLARRAEHLGQRSADHRRVSHQQQ